MHMKHLAFGAVAIFSAAGDGTGDADRMAAAGLSSASSSEQSSPRREEAERGREKRLRGNEAQLERQGGHILLH